MTTRNTEVSASVIRRTASSDMKYIYMCNRNSAAQNDVKKLKKHDQLCLT